MLEKAKKSRSRVKIKTKIKNQEYKSDMNEIKKGKTN